MMVVVLDGTANADDEERHRDGEDRIAEERHRFDAPVVLDGGFGAFDSAALVHTAHPAGQVMSDRGDARRGDRTMARGPGLDRGRAPATLVSERRPYAPLLGVPAPWGPAPKPFWMAVTLKLESNFTVT